MSETMSNLVKREGLYYKKFSEVPFSGKVTDPRFNKSGTIKNGKEWGTWIAYHDNGQLRMKWGFKNGKNEGLYKSYWEDGSLFAKGNYKNGKEEGVWIYYSEDGSVWKERSGTYKNGKKVSD